MSEQCPTVLSSQPPINPGPSYAPPNSFSPVLPLPPSFTFEQIQTATNATQPQANMIADLASQVADIMNRYKIQFNVGTVQFYTDNANDVTPELTITGQSVTTPILNFTLIPPKQGGTGPMGNMGSDGTSGYAGIPGTQGNQGYWGQQGLDRNYSSFNP